MKNFIKIILFFFSLNPNNVPFQTRLYVFKIFFKTSIEV